MAIDKSLESLREEDFQPFDNADEWESGLGNFDIEEPKVTGRKPSGPTKKFVSKFLKDTATGAGDALSVEIGRRLPKTSAMASELSQTYSEFNDMRREFSQKLQPTLISLEVSASKLLPQAKRLVPKRIYDKINKKLQDRQRRRDIDARWAYSPRSKESIESESIAAELSSVFADTSSAQIEYMAAQKAEERQTNMLNQALASTRNRQLENRLSDIYVANRYVAAFVKTTYTAYLKKSLELKYRHLFVSRDIFGAISTMSQVMESNLKIIAHNTALPEVNKITKIERMKEEYLKSTYGQWGQRLSGYISTFRDKLLGNIRDKVFERTQGMLGSFAGQLEQQADAAEMGRELGMEGQGIGSQISGLLARGLGGFLGVAGTRRIADKLQPFASDMEGAFGDIKTNTLMKVAQWRKRAANQPGLMGFLADIIPGFEAASVGTNKLLTNGTDAAIYDNITRQSIVEIIPGWLGKIHNEIAQLRAGSPQEEEAYDYYSRSFVPVSEMRSNMFDRIMGTAEQRSKDLSAAIGTIKAGHSKSQASEEDKMNFDNVQDDISKVIVNMALRMEALDLDTIGLYINEDPNDPYPDPDKYIATITKGTRNPKAVLRVIYDSCFPDGVYDKRMVDMIQQAVNRQSARDAFKTELPIFAEARGMRRYLTDIINKNDQINLDPIAAELRKKDEKTFGSAVDDAYESTLRGLQHSDEVRQVATEKISTVGSRVTGALAAGANKLRSVTSSSVFQPVDDFLQGTGETLTRVAKGDLKDRIVARLHERGIHIGNESQTAPAPRRESFIPETPPPSGIPSPTGAAPSPSSPQLTPISSAEDLANQAGMDSDQLGALILQYRNDFGALLDTLESKSGKKFDVLQLRMVMARKLTQLNRLRPEAAPLPQVQAPSSTVQTSTVQDPASPSIDDPGLGVTNSNSMLDAFKAWNVSWDERQTKRDEQLDTMLELVAGLQGIGGQGGGGLTGLAGKLVGAGGTIAKGYFNVYSSAIKGAFGLASKIAGGVLGAKEPYYDIYLKDNVDLGHPLLSAQKQARAPGVLFADTQERVLNSKDIDRPVIDAATGEVLISEEDLQHGLVTVSNRPLSKMVQGGLLLANNAVKGATGLLKGYFGVYGAAIKGISNILGGRRAADRPYVNIYLKDQIDPGKPILSRRKQESGVVFKDGTTVKRSEDIIEPVFDPQTKECLITEEDIKHGLVDVDNRPLGSGAGGGGGLAKKLLGNGSDMLKTLFKGGGSVVEMYTHIYKKLFDGAGAGLKWLFGAGKNPEKKYAPITDRLDLIYKLLDARLPEDGFYGGGPGGKRPMFGDADGDGDRDGSYEDIMEKRQAEKERREELAAMAAGGGGGDDGPQVINNVTNNTGEGGEGWLSKTVKYTLGGLGLAAGAGKFANWYKGRTMAKGGWSKGSKLGKGLYARARVLQRAGRASQTSGGMLTRGSKVWNTARRMFTSGKAFKNYGKGIASATKTAGKLFKPSVWKAGGKMLMKALKTPGGWGKKLAVLGIGTAAIAGTAYGMSGGDDDQEKQLADYKKQLLDTIDSTMPDMNDRQKKAAAAAMMNITEAKSIEECQAAYNMFQQAVADAAGGAIEKTEDGEAASEDDKKAATSALMITDQQISRLQELRNKAPEERDIKELNALGVDLNDDEDISDRIKELQMKKDAGLIPGEEGKEEGSPTTPQEKAALEQVGTEVKSPGDTPDPNPMQNADASTNAPNNALLEKLKAGGAPPPVPASSQQKGPWLTALGDDTTAENQSGIASAADTAVNVGYTAAPILGLAGKVAAKAAPKAAATVGLKAASGVASKALGPLQLAAIGAGAIDGALMTGERRKEYEEQVANRGGVSWRGFVNNAIDVGLNPVEQGRVIVAAARSAGETGWLSMKNFFRGNSDDKKMWELKNKRHQMLVQKLGGMNTPEGKSLADKAAAFLGTKAGSKEGFAISKAIEAEYSKAQAAKAEQEKAALEQGKDAAASVENAEIQPEPPASDIIKDASTNAPKLTTTGRDIMGSDPNPMASTQEEVKNAAQTAPSTQLQGARNLNNSVDKLQQGLAESLKKNESAAAQNAANSAQIAQLLSKLVTNGGGIKIDGMSDLVKASQETAKKEMPPPVVMNNSPVAVMQQTGKESDRDGVDLRKK